MDPVRGLGVWWDGVQVGVLSTDRSGDTQFRYLDTWLFRDGALPVSHSLPLREAPFTQRESRPFFDGLLPEEAQRDAVAAALGVSKGNHFKLLEELGGEVAGALTLWPVGEPPPGDTSSGKMQRLSEGELARVIERLPVRPLLAGEGELRLSLAGAQSKLPVIKDEEGIGLPAPGAPTTHILKPPIHRFDHTTENEAFIMRLAAETGLDVAPVEIGWAEGYCFLLVERYDRERAPDGYLRRVHQEDFCQALGCFPERKYAAEGGPVFRDCFQLLRATSTRPARELLKLLDAAIFNLIVGNADAHSKNFSLLYRAGETAMAPLYDLLSTVAYPDLAPGLAMKIANRTTLEEIRPTDWKVFAEETGMSEPYIRRRVLALSESVMGMAEVVVKQFDVPRDSRLAMGRFADLVRGRAKSLIERV